MVSALEVFRHFFSLGWISFGGPAAHIGYFQKHFVDRLKWLSQDEYGQLVALSQMLPGPGSSQVGFALGLHRAGVIGGVCAFVGFTLPSFLLMYALVVWQSHYIEYSEFASGVVDGLKLLAVVIVADAILSMLKSFAQTLLTQSITVLTAVLLLIAPSVGLQMICLTVAAVVGIVWLNTSQGNTQHTLESSTRKKSTKQPLMAYFALVSFALLFVLTYLTQPVMQWLDLDGGTNLLSLFSQFYQAGSLVFGGGHVVLPLLQQTIGDSMTQDQFLLGYAAAQGVPGPMFTLATFLGGSLTPESLLTGATIATLGIFLPGFLLVLAVKPFFQKFAKQPRVAGAFAGVNASVVGLLLAAFYQPVFISSVTSGTSFAAVILGYLLINRFKVGIVWLVLGFAIFGVLASLLSQ